MSIMDRLLPPALSARLKSKKTSSKTKSQPAVKKVVLQKAKKAPISILVPEPPKAPHFFGTWRLGMVVVALALAGLGQYHWMQNGDPAGISQGWKYFGWALLLFIVALFPWKSEEIQNAPVSPKLEKFLVGAVLLVAAFFRVYHLDQMPPGIFYDQGICGNITLQILHEHYRPFYPDNMFRLFPVLMYALAGWFYIVKVSAFNFFLFFALMGTASLFFIYWTFKQLFGVRTALVSTYILAVMSWNVSFSRNGFPTIEVPFHMFGTLAFLLYGLNNRKRWPFVVASIFFAMGMYSYQAYRIFPVLLILFGIYEWFTRRERIKENLRNLTVFGILFIVLSVPFFMSTIRNASTTWREQNYNIVAQMKEQHSFTPAYNMITRTAMMFNREGDSNERHNYPNHRMLDDITGALFILGLAYSITRLFQRQFFFAVIGFFVMCLPCLLSQDAAHANRLLGSTPFIALLATLPLIVLWDRVRFRWKRVGDIVFALLLLEPMFLMGVQNYEFYFGKQAHFNGLWTTSVWAGYCVSETRVGQTIAREGDKYDYFLTPRYYDYPSINFLGYDQKKNIKKFLMPDDLSPLKADGTRGVYYVMMKEHEGLLRLLQQLYPHGIVQREKDLEGNTIVSYFIAPKEDVQAARGLSGTVDGQAFHWPDYPNGLPIGGSHRITLKGCLFVDKASRYSFTSRQPNHIRVHIANRSVLPGTQLELARGYYSIEAEWNSTSEGSDPGLRMVSALGQPSSLNASNTTTLPLNHGLKGSWYCSTKDGGDLKFTQWNPIINLPQGGDFNFPYDPLFIHWEGILHAPESGEYVFSTKTEEYCSLTIDGRSVFELSKNSRGSIHLAAGNHTFKFLFKKILGPTLTLFWKIPSQNGTMEVPMDAFGETREGF
jgi:4-amino-4-deoxy-L-arabinose transferase-like glycosyltransferase